MADRDRPLSGRELGDQHRALVRAGATPAFTLAWLRREVALWDRRDAERDAEADGPA